MSFEHSGGQDVERHILIDPLTVRQVNLYVRFAQFEMNSSEM